MTSRSPSPGPKHGPTHTLPTSTASTPAGPIPAGLIPTLDGCAGAPVLTPLLLSRIHRLNLEYLQLLREARPGMCAHLDGLPAVLLQSLRRVSAARLPVLAATPYALYTLGFEDQEFWLAALGGAADDSNMPGSNVFAAPCVADDGAGCRVPLHAAFGETVIFFAWHLTVANPLAARVMCGVPGAVSESLQSASFAKLQAVMRTCPWVLMPRWAAHPRFWPELIEVAVGADVEAVRQVQLLGNQLIACDLRLAESPPPELAGRLRAARSIQLQRWKLRR